MNIASRDAWLVNVPANLSDTGARRQMSFSTRREAEVACEQLRVRQDNFGVSLTVMSPARITEAAEAFNLLEGTSIGLLEAVQMAKKIYDQRASSIPFLELYKRFIETKGHCHVEYQKAHRWHCDRYPELHARLATDITTGELERLLQPLGPGARDHAIKYWRAVFEYGIGKKFLAENPIAGVDKKKAVSDEAEIISNHHVWGLLNHALESDLPLLPYFVFGFFAGLRPDGELLKLDWAARFDTRKIIMTRRITKKKHTRYPELNDTAIAWLRAYEARGGAMTGPVVTYGGSALRSARVKAQFAAGMEKWVQQGARHTFSSNWLALYKDENKLVLMNGHSRDVLWDSYVHGLTEEQGRSYFAILPPQGDENIVPFKSQAQT